MSERKFQVCIRCLMDTTDEEITFNENGECNHCVAYIQKTDIRIIPEHERESKRNALIEQIKKDGKGKPYDCIIGVSGGTDSTYVAYLVKKWGLRPLAVHLDNGWNTELSVDNINMILKKLDIDLFTIVIDWEEFKDLQKSFLKASIPNIEVPTDHAIFSTMYIAADKYNIKYILSGSNYNDEGIFPDSWANGQLDLRFIKDIHGKFGKAKFKTYPHLSLLKLFYMMFVKKIKLVAILNYLPFNKNEARALIEKELGWRNYGGKHYENIYTRFMQAYILPRKFNIDVRKPYLSAPLLRGQISREEALEELKKPTAPKEMLDSDREYFIKKLEMAETEFENMMNAPNKNYLHYKSNYKTFLFLRKLLNIARRSGLAHS